METIVNDFSIGLFLWQTFLIMILLAVVTLMYKLYKWSRRYLIDRRQTDH